MKKESWESKVVKVMGNPVRVYKKVTDEVTDEGI